MSTQRRSGSRRPSVGGAAARGGRSAGTIDATVDEVVTDPSASGGSTQSDAAIRAARAEERRVRIEEPVPRSVLGERLSGLRGLFDDTKAEIKKVTWPDKDTTRNLTIVVIGISVVMGIVLGGIDFVLFQIFEALP